jgi:hypothetical protein
MIGLKGATHDAHDPRARWRRAAADGGSTMLERVLPIPGISAGKELGTREPSQAREFIGKTWERVKGLLRALVDFFAGGGPLS